MEFATSTQDLDGTPKKLDTRLPGFNPERYLELNPDVAAAGVDAKEHYVSFGRAECRAVCIDGTRIYHPESRLFSDVERADWLACLKTHCENTSLRAIIETHPRAWWLETGFTLASYLQQCQDVATAIDSPLQAAFHFLEFGIEEGRMGRALACDAQFVGDMYGVEDTDDLASTIAAVRATGVSPLDIVLNEVQLWELLGGTGQQLSELFDHEYYHAIASHKGYSLSSFKRFDCIHHFMSDGIDACLPINPDLEFDAAFYFEMLTDFEAAGLETEDVVEKGDLVQRAVLYRHWAETGLRRRVMPNCTSWAKIWLGVDVPQAIIKQLALFQTAASLSADLNTAQILEQLVRHPYPAITALEFSDPKILDFVSDLAGKLVADGDQDQAERMYWLVLSYSPQNDHVAHHLADLLQRQGRMDIVQVLRQGISKEYNHNWNTLNLSEIYLNQGRFEDAIETIDSLSLKAMADVAVADKKRALALGGFQRIWHNIARHVSGYGLERTQNQIRKTLQAYTPDFKSVHRARAVKNVALVGNMDLYQCKLYRVDQKAEQLRAAGYNVTVYSASQELGDFIENIGSFEAVIFFRVAAFGPMIDAIASASQHGLLTFYEIDDIVFDTEHFPPSLESYAGQIDEAHYNAMACGVPLFEHAMSMCDYGIASTQTIKTLMEKRVRTGIVLEHHNALGNIHMMALRDYETRLAKQEHDKSKPLVLFYGSGTKAHKEDFHDILEPALAEMVRRHPGKVEIRLIGHFGEFTHLDMQKDPVHLIEPVWDFEEFCALVSQADINLSVLQRSLLTDAKSEIKWMEAALFGIPSVVSDTATHQETIAHGKTGFLAKDTKEFINVLDLLITDSDLRERIGAAAQEHVKSTYALSAMGERLGEQISALRPQLDVPKKRLLIVNVFYPPQAIGGATRVVHDNVRDLREKYGDEFEIDVVCTLDGGQRPFEVTTYSQDNVRVWAITAPHLEDGEMTPRNAEMGAVFDRLLDRIRPDLVHFHCIQRLTASAVDAARYRNIPYVITLHDGWWISPNQFIMDDNDNREFYDFAPEVEQHLNERARKLRRPLIGAAALLAVSDSFGQLHEECGLERVEVVENGVSNFLNVKRQPSTSGRVRLAHIGGASRHKGIHLVRNALLSTPFDNLELLLIDHAMPANDVRQEVWGTTPVTIMGKVSQADVTDLYGKIDVLLAPSIWPESYGLVTREAISAGVWVITSDQGAIGADVTEGKNGHRVDIATYKGLVECLTTVDANTKRYLASPTIQPMLRQASMQVDDLVKVYDRIISGVS